MRNPFLKTLLAAGGAALAFGWTPVASADEVVAFRGPVVLDNGVPTQAVVGVSAGNPLPVAAVGAYGSTLPTYSTGQRTDLQADVQGRLEVDLGAQSGAGTDATSNSLSFVTTDAARNRRPLAVGNWIFNGAAWDRQRSIQGADGTGLGVVSTVASPVSSAAAAIAPAASPSVESSRVVKAAAGNLYRVAVTTGASGGYLMVFDATAAPADGAVTPKICRVVGANASLDLSYPTPARFATGITVVFSTTGCFSKTASATAFIEALAL